jgi:hypothetical protein
MPAGPERPVSPSIAARHGRSGENSRTVTGILCQAQAMRPGRSTISHQAEVKPVTNDRYPERVNLRGIDTAVSRIWPRRHPPSGTTIAPAMRPEGRVAGATHIIARACQCAPAAISSSLRACI